VIASRSGAAFSSEVIMKRFVFFLVLLAGSAVVGGPEALPRSFADDKKEEKGGLTFEVYKEGKDEFRWRLKAANGRVIGTSAEGYKAKADCEHGVQLIMDGAAKAKVEDLSAK
jgi:uncharacterized protein YegP (UPF0339 family)